MSLSRYSIDCYALLEVEPTASKEDFEKNYKTLLLKHHPDKNLENQAEAVKKTALLNQAIKILRDERSEYDEYLRMQVKKNLTAIERLKQQRLQQAEETRAAALKTFQDVDWDDEENQIPGLDFGDFTAFAGDAKASAPTSSSSSSSSSSTKDTIPTTSTHTTAIDTSNIDTMTLDTTSLLTPFDSAMMSLNYQVSCATNLHYTNLQNDLKQLLSTLEHNKLLTTENLIQLTQIDLKQNPKSLFIIHDILLLLKSYNNTTLNQSLFDKVLSFHKVETVEVKPITYSSSSSMHTQALTLFAPPTFESVIVPKNILADLHSVLSFSFKKQIFSFDLFEKIFQLQQWLSKVLNIFKRIENFVEPDIFKEIIAIQPVENIEEINKLLTLISEKLSDISGFAYKDHWFKTPNTEVAKLFYQRLFTNLLKADIDSSHIARISLAINEFQDDCNYLVGIGGWHYTLLLTERPEAALLISAGIIAARNGEFNSSHVLTQKACAAYIKHQDEPSTTLDLVLKVYIEFAQKYDGEFLHGTMDEIFRNIMGMHSKMMDQLKTSNSTAIVLLPPRGELVLSTTDALPLILQGDTKNVIPTAFNPALPPLFKLSDKLGQSSAAPSFFAEMNPDRDRITSEYAEQIAFEEEIFAESAAAREKEPKTKLATAESFMAKQSESLLSSLSSFPPVPYSNKRKRDPDDDHSPSRTLT